MTEHERLLQGRVNFVRMLEIMYDTDIKLTKDLTHWYNKWLGDGRVCISPEVVPLRRSKSLRRASRSVVEPTNVIGGRQKKELPWSWDDAL